MPVDRDRLSASALVLAPRLLGAVLTSTIGGARVAIRLTEVEAYAGSDDPASHAFRGPTARTEVMFGPPGHLYCYFTYGMHWCANVVCGPDRVATAVLLRAGAVIAGRDIAQKRRPAARTDRELARGPARLARCLGIDGAANGVDLCDPRSLLQLNGLASRRRPGVRSGPRIGISVAAERPWRFWLADDPTVSPFRPSRPKSARNARQTERRD